MLIFSNSCYTGKFQECKGKVTCQYFNRIKEMSQEIIDLSVSHNSLEKVMEQITWDWINKKLKAMSRINASSFVFTENNPIKSVSHYTFCNVGWDKSWRKGDFEVHQSCKLDKVVTPLQINLFCLTNLKVTKVFHHATKLLKWALLASLCV